MNPLQYITHSTANPYTDYTNMVPRFYQWYNSKDKKSLDDAWEWLEAFDILSTKTYSNWTVDYMNKFEQLQNIRIIIATAQEVIRSFN